MQQGTTTTKVKVTSNGTTKVITRSRKVHSGSREIEAAYEPVGAFKRASIEGQYIGTNGYSAQKSEERKKQLLMAIKETRRELRNVPLSKQWVTPTKVRHNSLQVVQEALMSLDAVSKFINCIFNHREQTNQSCQVAI